MVASTTISVDDAGLIGVNDYVSVNGTGARVTAKSGNTLTLDTAVTGNTGDNVNPVIAFVLRYENTGNADATNVTVDDPLPANTVFVAADSGGTHDAGSPGTVSWALGTVPAGGAGSLKFWARPTVAGTYNNTGTIDSDETPPTNSNTTVTTIGALEPSKVTSTPNVANPGAQATYTISIFNGTGAPATDVSVTDEMEKGFSFDSNVSFNITGGAGGSRTSTTDPTSGDNPATWCCWTLSAGATLAIEYLANLSDEVGDGTYQNNVTVASLSSSDLPFDFLATTQEDVTVNWTGPNHVVVSWIEASYESGAVEITWQTDAEVRTAGFYLKRYLEETESYQAVHEEMLRAVVGSPQGGTYRVVDLEAPVGVPLSYLLVEVENDGKERTYGPYRLTPSSEPAIVQPPSFEPSTRSHQAAGQAAHATPRTGRAALVPGVLAGASLAPMGLRGSRRSAKAVRGLKIAVDRPGLYRVEGHEIAEAFGLDLRRAAQLIRRHRLRLTVEGKEVPYLVEGKGMTANLLFYGEGIDSIYTPHRIYRLAISRSKRMAAVRGNPRSVSEAGQTFRDTVRFEEDHVPLVLGEVDGDSDFWFWDYVIAGDPPKSFGVDLVGVAPSTGDALLTVYLRGAVNTGAGGHRVRILVNGQSIGEAGLQGFEGREFSFTLSPHLLREGINTVELEGVSDPNVPYSIVYLDSLSVSYDREYWASGGSLLAFADGHDVLTVDGFQTADVRVLDITDPDVPRRVRQAQIGASPSGNYQTTFAAERDGRYLAV